MRMVGVSDGRELGGRGRRAVRRPGDTDMKRLSIQNFLATRFTTQHDLHY